MAQTVTFGKQQLVLYSIIGPAITLLLGVVIGIGMLKTDPTHEKTHTKMPFQEMTASNIKENWKYISDERPSPNSNQNEDFLFEYVQEKWKTQLDKVKIYTHEVTLPTINDSDPNYVGIIGSDDNFQFKSTGFECNAKQCVDAISEFNALSNEGHVQGELVFANFGTEKDFENLLQLGINPKEKICIVKYAGLSLKHAQDYGCSAAIVYADPANFADDQASRNTHKDPIQPQVDIDPMADIIHETSADLLTIPRLLVPTEDGKILLSKLVGPVAPKSWWGKLPITYKLGGSMDPTYHGHKFVMHVGKHRRLTEVRNVVGYVFGREERDRYVMLGNNRGNIGTAIMMEMARAIGDLSKSNIWRPRRTVVFCSWADVSGTLGSNKWIEQMEKVLLYRGVVYLNMDNPMQGDAILTASGSPELQKSFFEAVHRVYDPALRNVPVYHGPTYRSGHFALLANTGVSSINLKYTLGENRPSEEESLEAFDDLKYSLTLQIGQLWAELATMFADDVILPFDHSEYMYVLEEMITSLLNEHYHRFSLHNIETQHLTNALKKFKTAVKELGRIVENIDGNSPSKVRIVNDKLMHFNRMLLDMLRLFGTTNHRHVIFGSSKLPGVMSAIRRANVTGDWKAIAKQLSMLTFHINAAAATLSENW